MSFHKEFSTPKESEQADRVKETDRPQAKNSDNYQWTPAENKPGTDLSDALNSAFKALGLAVETNSEKKSETNEPSENKDYSKYLDKGDDGKYYDKETGKAYDSIEAWEKAQEALTKRYEETSEYYEEKSKKEYAHFKNAEQNGESDAEKWEHYRHSQEYYTKAKECKEQAAHVREKLEQNEKSDKSDTGETDETNNKNDASDSPEKNKPIQNKCEGMRREAEVKKELEEDYPSEEGYEIIPEVYLRDADGNIVKDPETGKARRIDFVVVKDGKVVDSIEVTSQTADKRAQSAKENRIRENGGNYVRDSSGNLIKIDVDTRLERRNLL